MLPGQDGLAEDGDLLARIACSEVAALAAFFDRHSARAFGLALRVLGDAAAAEAVVAEAFLALWRQTARSDPACGWTIPTWLFRLVRAGAFARQRVEQRHRGALPPGEPRGQRPADSNVRAAP
jgi:RNA polymerase sigma-70 factor (ECF subfamily)